MRTILVCLIVLAAGCTGSPDEAAPAASAKNDTPSLDVSFAALEPELPTAVPTVASAAAGGDVVVIAVVDDGFSPYLFDFASALLPQHRDADPSNDVPLDRSPAEWLHGFDPTAFASFEPMRLNLSADPDADPAALVQRDAAAWASFPASTPDEVHLRYVPGTKIVGMVDFGGEGFAGGVERHGTRTSGVAAGNLHGTCPECLVVLVQNGGSEAASQWVQSQPWIDVVTNSWASSDAGRTFVYSGADVGMQRDASERGQTIFWSASNGVDGGGVAPILTYESSQMGPDWIMTVAGASPSGGTWSGTGKPADLAALSEAVPSPGGAGLAGAGEFDGVSAGTPLAAGTFARALYFARAALPGASRAQAEGALAIGEPFACGAERADCELADGVLTAREMRTRFLQGLARTEAGMKLGPSPPAPAVAEEEFAAEGHGTIFGRFLDDEAWAQEVARIVGPITGDAKPLARPTGEAEWFVVDSYCRQTRWATWRDGDYDGTNLPPPDPLFPLRQALAAMCAVPDP